MNLISASASAPLYHATSRGGKIVLADSGIATPHFVGSAEEGLYYKVIFNACTFDRLLSARGSHRVALYYETPRDYCAHYVTHLFPAAQSITATSVGEGIPLARNYKQRRQFRPEDEFMIQAEVQKCLESLGSAVDKWRLRSQELFNHNSIETEIITRE